MINIRTNLGLFRFGYRDGGRDWIRRGRFGLGYRNILAGIVNDA